MWIELIQREQGVEPAKMVLEPPKPEIVGEYLQRT